MASLPLFLSQRSPRFSVRWRVNVQVSLKKREWVRKFVPRLASWIGHQMS
jgi:hypothetical protein